MLSNPNLNTPTLINTVFSSKITNIVKICDRLNNMQMILVFYSDITS
ncbi:1053_t:CDS:1, partial [Gigaspora rosea]